MFSPRLHPLKGHVRFMKTEPHLFLYRAQLTNVNIR